MAELLAQKVYPPILSLFFQDNVEMIIGLVQSRFLTMFLEGKVPSTAETHKLDLDICLKFEYRIYSAKRWGFPSLE